MRSGFLAGAMLAMTAVAPLRAQSLTGARAGLSIVRTQAAAMHDAAIPRSGNSPRVSKDGASDDKWAKGMVAGAAVGLLVGLLINVNQVQNGGTHSAILPAVGVGALLGLLIGSG